MPSLFIRTKTVSLSARILHKACYRKGSFKKIHQVVGLEDFDSKTKRLFVTTQS
jgi:hypothetical protein